MSISINWLTLHWSIGRPVCHLIRQTTPFNQRLANLTQHRLKRAY